MLRWRATRRDLARRSRCARDTPLRGHRRPPPRPARAVAVHASGDALRRREEKTRDRTSDPAQRTAEASSGPYDSQALLFKGQNLGKYKIVAPLGSGGFGTV